MQRRSLLLLMTLAALLGGLFFWLQRAPEPLPEQDTRYLPGLDPQQVSAVRIERPGQPPIEVARKDGGWVMPAKEDYRAAGRLIGDLLLELAQARKVEPKTRDPANFPRLGLAEKGEGAAVRLTVLRSSGAPVDLLLGKAAQQGGRLVRQPGNDQAWLIDQPLNLPPDELDWLDRRITAIAFEDIAEVSVRYPQGETLTVFRDQPGEPNLRVRQLPKGTKLPVEAAANGMALPFGDLRFNEVAPLSQVQFKGLPQLSLTVKTLDGAHLLAHLQRQGDQPWLLLDRIEGFAEGQVLARSDWAYRLEAEQADALARRLADFKGER